MKENYKKSGIWIEKMELPELVSLANKKSSKKNIKKTAIFSGSYLNKIKGRGMEFAEARLYQPGDDVRHIDWRVTARSGKTHTKLFREERERPVMLLLDQSRSMFFGSKIRLKSVQAARIAALIGWHSLLNGDRVGGVLFSEKSHCEFRPRSSQKHYLRLLSNITTDHNYIVDNMKENYWDFNYDYLLNHALRRLRHVVQSGSLVYIFSDFSGYNEESRKHFFQLTKHSQVNAFLVIDPLEKEISTRGRYAMSDGRNISWFNAGESEIRKKFFISFKKNHLKLAKELRMCRVKFKTLSTIDDLPMIKN